MTDREVLPGCARVRTKCAEKTKCWSVGTNYILEKLPDVSGPGLVEAGRYKTDINRTVFLDPLGRRSTISKVDRDWWKKVGGRPEE